MRTKIFCGLFFFFLLVFIPFAGYGNSDRKYCESLLDSARKKYSEKNYIKAMESLTEARKIAEENNWTDLKIDALNGMGAVYTSLFDYDKAMEYYLESYKIATKKSDTKRELLIINNIGKIYFDNQEYSKVKEYLEKAYEIAFLLKDSFCIRQVASNLASVLHKTEDFILAEKYLNIGLKMLNNDTATREYLTFQIIKTDNLYLQKKYSEAEKIGLSIWERVQKIDHAFKHSFVICLSKIYQEKGNIEKALYYAYEALQGSPDIVDCICIYDQLSDLYQLENAYPLALQYKDSAAMAIDSLRKINNKDYLKSNLIRFELLNSEKELAESKAKQKAERMLFIVVIIAIFILAMIFIWVLRIQSIRNKQRKQITELELQHEKNQNLLQQEQLNNEKLRLEQQLKEQETFALLEQERLASEIDNKNKQLMARVLFQSNRNDLIKELIVALSNIPLQKESTIIEPIVQKLRLQLKDSADANIFLVQLEQISPSLFLLLKEKHPNLSLDEIQLLSYIHLYNIDTKKIASLLNISVNTCQKRKERLAIKMGIKTTELYDFLCSLMSFSIPDNDVFNN